MARIHVHDRHFEIYITAAQIQEQVARVAAEINRDYAGKKPLFIAILNGSFIFASDLFRELGLEAEICFIKLASYSGIKSTGRVTTSIGLDVSIAGRDVIVLEDIVDTGKTLHEFLPQLAAQAPASLKIATFLFKPEALTHPIQPEYVGFRVPPGFLLGYGLDYDGLGRNLKDVYQLSDASAS